MDSRLTKKVVGDSKNPDNMNISRQQLNSFRSILLSSLVILFFSCSTSRHIENKQKKEVYNTLGLSKERKDNFALYKEAVSWLQIPHADGGSSRNATDCSFLVYSIYKTVYHKTLERNSSDMFQKNCKMVSRKKLREGNLVFFSTSGKSKSHISHVGIYLKKNKFLHASTSKGVIVSDLDEAYYRRVWVCGGKVK